MKKQTPGNDKKNAITKDEDPAPLSNDIDPGELELLDTAGEDDEERSLHHAELDDRDDDGDLLNEISSSTDKSGLDLDVPGSEADDDNEDIGEEDEENNSYSLKDPD